MPVLFAVAFIFAVRRYTRRLGPVLMEQRVQYGQVTATAEEAVSGIELVKAAVRETWERKRFHASAALFRDLFVRQGRIEALYVPMLMFGVAMALALLHGILLLRAGGIELSELIALIGLMHLLRIPAFMSAFSFAMVQNGIAGARRVLSVLTATTELDQNSGGRQAAVRGAIAFEGVSFGYQDGQKALSGHRRSHRGRRDGGDRRPDRLRQDHADATGQPHLRPPAPAGSPSTASICGAWNLTSLRSQIANIEQDVFLFSRTVAENIAFGPPRRQPPRHRIRRPRRRRARLH